MIPGYTYERISIERPGGIRLVGYRLASNKAEKASRALLFLQGNAMRVDQLRHKLTYFADRGFDVLVFDYRGYGESGGDPLLDPISRDQAAVAAFVRDLGYDRTYLYGISIGGILALGPYVELEPFDAIAIDSSPARLPWYAMCPDSFDPVANVPDAASNVIVLSGGLDRIVEAEDVAPLGAAVADRGGTYVHEAGFGHPLSDGYGNTERRFSIVLGFFDRAAGRAPAADGTTGP